jgi:hypothetical protein
MMLFKSFLKLDIPILSQGEDTYLTLMKKLMDRDVMKQTQDLLKSFKIDHLVKYRGFLTSIAVCWFSEEFMSMTPEQERSIICSKAKELLKSFHQSLINERKEEALEDRLLEYLKAFEEWREMDVLRWKTSLLNSYRETHHSYLLIKKEIDHEYIERWLKDIEGLKTKIRSKISMFKGDKELLECDSIDKMEDLKTVDLDQIIKEVGCERYWKELEVQLSEEPPVWDRLINLLTEIRDRFCKIHPSESEAYKTNIDISYITQLMRRCIFGKDDMVILTRNILESFFICQAPEDDNNMEKWMGEVLERFESEDFKWTRDIPILLNSVLVKMDRLEDQIEVLRNANNTSSN